MNQKILVDINANLETGDLTISDTTLGTRTVKASDGAVAIIRDQLRLLKAYQAGGNRTQHLRRDIRVYKYILNSDCPEKLADEYLRMAQQMRAERETVSIEKIEVAKRLGWNV